MNPDITKKDAIALMECFQDIRGSYQDQRKFVFVCLIPSSFNIFNIFKFFIIIFNN